MAINKNHEFEELNGIKCGIVEKNANADRVAFLQSLLAFNQYEVVVVPAAAPKAAPKPATETEVAGPTEEVAAAPSLFNIGVTDYTFNPINAIFGRLLKAPNGKIVTLAYWQQKEVESNDEKPYFD